MFKKRKSGLTLLELVVAVALLAIILLPIIRSFATSARVNSKSRDIMNATDVAQAIMEGISGKTYMAVVKGLEICDGGFDFSRDGRAGSGAFAFTSLNQNFYNAGVAAKEADNHISGVTILANHAGVDKSGVELDKAMANEAIIELQARVNAGEAAGTLYGPYEDNWTGDKTSTENLISMDKSLIYGFSSEEYADGTPVLAYMLYSRLQKDNHFYDAVVTFIPAAQNVNVQPTIGADEYFAYRVRIAMYEYDYDDHVSGGEWPSRFDAAEATLEGTPTAVLETGIQFK